MFNMLLTPEGRPAKSSLRMLLHKGSLCVSMCVRACLFKYSLQWSISRFASFWSKSHSKE